MAVQTLFRLFTEGSPFTVQPSEDMTVMVRPRALVWLASPPLPLCLSQIVSVVESVLINDYPYESRPDDSPPIY